MRWSCEPFVTFFEFGSCQWRLATFGTVVGNCNEGSGVAFANCVTGSTGGHLAHVGDFKLVRLRQGVLRNA
jgi:hypothetical protein